MIPTWHMRKSKLHLGSCANKFSRRLICTDSLSKKYMAAPYQRITFWICHHGHICEFSTSWELFFSRAHLVSLTIIHCMEIQTFWSEQRVRCWMWLQYRITKYFCAVTAHNKPFSFKHKTHYWSAFEKYVCLKHRHILISSIHYNSLGF